jgi:hypothetical protein
MAKADEKGFSLKRGVALLPRLLPHVGNVQAKESKANELSQGSLHAS